MDQNPAPLKTGLVGHPVGHSKSPAIHNFWRKKYGIGGEYVLVDCLPEDLEETLASLKKQGFAGFNVTVPHKQAVMELCDELDDTARAIGAVNTVRIGADGKLSGFNTDAFGFLENVRAQAPEAFRFQSAPAAVLGAGGAARAVVHALLEAGAPEVLMFNRTKSRADDLAARASAPERVKALDWELRGAALDGAGFLVNTTSLGMAGKPALAIDLARLPQKAVVADIVYVPLMTDLLVQGKQRGLAVVTGLGMLLHQARPGFSLWHGVMPEVDDTLLAELSP